MEQEFETRGPDGVLRYGQGRDGVILLAYEGRKNVLRLPDTAGGRPVTEIAKKAFLSCKTLQSVELHAGIRRIGDWAFAYCTGLSDVLLPGGRLETGRGIFRECAALRTVRTPAGTQTGAYLLAAAAGPLDAWYLFDPAEAGSPAWLEKWDAAAAAFLERSDKEGYSKLLLCGEEDYGSKENDLDFFLSQKRRRKAELAFLRLLHPDGLRKEFRDIFSGYIREHAKGSASGEAWELVLAKHTDERAYYEALAQAGAVTVENVGPMLEDMKEKSPECKAFLLKYKKEKLGGGDFFDSLTLEEW